MEKNKKNEELQSRREFFKRAAKGVLPIFAVVALADIPSLVRAEKIPTSCDYCEGTCHNGCENRCSGCDGCTGGCDGTCKGGCDSSCKGSCDTTCRGGCGAVAGAG